MLCVDRGFQRLKGDASLTISRVVANTILAVVVGELELDIYGNPITNCSIGSMFYNLDYKTASFHSRSVLIFLAILLNAFASALEVRFPFFLHVVDRDLSQPQHAKKLPYLSY